MSDDLRARKGAAVPAPERPGDRARIRRRVVVLPPIDLHAEREDDGPAGPGRAPDAAGPRPDKRRGADRRRFTFRIDPVRHAAFAAAAERRGVSRQRLLTEALDALLAKLGRAYFGTPAPVSSDSTSSGADGVASLLPEGVAALPPPL